LTTWNRQVFWSISEKVSYLTVTQKSTERYRHRPHIASGGHRVSASLINLT
jgi:hypothetical protein